MLVQKFYIGRPVVRLIKNQDTGTELFQHYFVLP